jgi:hypothetical protein
VTYLSTSLSTGASHGEPLASALQDRPRTEPIVSPMSRR